MIMAKILIACEESQAVCIAFRNKGHEAYSCDILPCSGGHPEWHIQDDVLKYLTDGWDLMIAHPPCTYLCRNRAKLNKQQGLIPDNTFFYKLLNAPIKKICIENPVPSKQSMLPKYTQIIQPWQFGHDASKKTCLWLKNLPLIFPTKIVEYTHIVTSKGYRYTTWWYKTPRTSIARSKTFSGIAEAMANQWGDLL